MLKIYSEPEAYDLPRKGVTLNNKEAALVVVDPQIGFLSPQGIGQEVFKDNIVENSTVENLGTLFKTTKGVQMPVFISPCYYFPHDYRWQSTAPGETFTYGTEIFGREGPLTMENSENSDADFLPQFRPYVYNGKTIIASPHEIFGPETNSLALQLRECGVSQTIFAGMAANLCIEPHMRELTEQGLEVIVVRGATAGPRTPEGDGYLAALTNYRIIANNLWDTDTTVEKVRAAAK